jgi:hypothetical protein
MTAARWARSEGARVYLTCFFVATRIARVIAVAPGENAFLYALDRFLLARRERTRGEAVRLAAP